MEPFFLWAIVISGTINVIPPLCIWGSCFPPDHAPCASCYFPPRRTPCTTGGHVCSPVHASRPCARVDFLPLATVVGAANSYCGCFPRLPVRISMDRRVSAVSVRSVSMHRAGDGLPSSSIVGISFRGGATKGWTCHGISAATSILPVVPAWHRAQRLGKRAKGGIEIPALRVATCPRRRRLLSQDSPRPGRGSSREKPDANGPWTFGANRTSIFDTPPHFSPF